MRKKICFILISIVSLSACANNENGLKLTTNGKPLYSIVLSKSSTAPEKQAAKQLKYYLDKISSGDFRIITESASSGAAGQKNIFIGKTNYLASNIPKANLASLKNDGTIIKTIGGNLVLSGDGPRGTLYAVYDFLEIYLKCKWWTPDEQTIPNNKNISIPGINQIYIPPFSYRSHFIYNSLNSAEFAVALHENGDNLPLDDTMGGKIQILGWVHTFSTILPPEKYFKSHPEWYSDPNNGNKPSTAKTALPDPQATQLCMSDPAMQKVFLENTMKWIAENPSYNIISISQNDNKGYCHCPACQAIIDEEGAPSGLLLRFVNRIAKAVAQKYPDKKVETLAYLFSEKPPKITKPDPNVIIRFAPIDADFGYPLNSNKNGDVRSNLIQWSSISKNNFFWGYSTNFGHPLLPYPSLYHLKDDLLFLQKNNFKGIFIQDNTNPPGYGYFTDMKAWITGHLLWNPSLDYPGLIDEFMTGYYGDAGIYMKQYYQLIDEAFLKSNSALTGFGSNASFVSPRVLEQGKVLFTKALSQVKNNKVITDRINKEKISLDFTELYTYPALQASRTENSSGSASYTQKEVKFFGGLENLKYANINVYNALVKYRDVLRDDLESVHKNNLNTSRAGNQYILQQDKFDLYQRGQISNIVNDPSAADRRAASVIGSSNAWAVRVVFKGYDKSLFGHTYNIIPSLKVNLTGNNPVINANSTIDIGVYNEVSKVYAVSKSFKISDLTAGYKKITLTGIELNQDDIIWFSVNAKNNEVQTLFIDQVELDKVK